MNKTLSREAILRFCKRYMPLAVAVVLAVVLLSGRTVYTPAGSIGTDSRIGTAETAPSAAIVYLGGDSEAVNALLADGAQVTVRADDAEHTIAAENETLPALLRRLNVLVGPLDTVVVTVHGEALEITAGARPVCQDVTTEPIPRETVRVASPDLPQGKERVAQEGADGVRTTTCEVTFFGGKEVAREVVSVEETAGEDRIVEYGTAAVTLADNDRIADVQKNDDGSGVLTFKSGATLKFSSVKGVTATAYTAGRGGAGYITAIGTPARPGAVAVDPRVIPLGSKLYIVTNDGKYVYGLAVAEDTGVIGDRVDLYYDDYNYCLKFGRRKATIYILED